MISVSSSALLRPWDGNDRVAYKVSVYPKISYPVKLLSENNKTLPLLFSWSYKLRGIQVFPTPTWQLTHMAFTSQTVQFVQTYDLFLENRWCFQGTFLEFDT